MKASLSAAHYAALMMPYEILVSTMKSVRRDEVARLYGVSESVKNALLINTKTIYVLLP
jgi:predicted transcriptional regulator